MHRFTTEIGLNASVSTFDLTKKKKKENAGMKIETPFISSAGTWF